MTLPATPPDRSPDWPDAPPGGREAERQRAHDAAAALLDHAHDRLAAGDPAGAMGALVPALGRLRGALPADAWAALGADRCRAHPVAQALYEDPFTGRAFHKPRGYAGDAGTLDLIYGAVPVPADTTPLGRALYGVNVLAPACRSVRERRAILAGALDRAGAEAPGRARVLSLACGHLREAQASAAVRDGAVAAFYALDQDPLAVALLGAEHAPLGVTAAAGSVGDVLRGRVAYPDLTLAYAAGLYDYLPAPVAARLTARLFGMLAPGGRLLVANFCPDLPDAGFMEAFMDWRLIYRDEADMRALAAGLPEGEVARRRVYRDTVGAVVYLDVERA